MTMTQLMLVMTPNALLLFLIVILILRPMSVFWSTHKSGLSGNEKWFLSWVSPRGIVAAGVVSLFGIELVQMGEPGAEMITPLVFMIVLGTVLLKATTAGFVGKKLGVTNTVSNGIIIVGANPLGRLIGKYLLDNGRHVILHDSSKNNNAETKKLGLETIQGDIYEDILDEHLEVSDVGYLLAMTGNDEINAYASDRFKDTLGENGTYRLPSKKEIQENTIEPEPMFSISANYLNAFDLAQKNGQIHELEIKNKPMFLEVVAQLQQNNAIPLFIKTPSGKINVVSAQLENNEIGEMDKLIYFGIPL